MRATYGYPLWQETTNTKKDFDEVAFDNAEGYNIDLDGYLGYTVSNGVEVGLYGGYALQHRNGGGKIVEIDGEPTVVEWPENNLAFMRLGMMFVWKFRE